MPDGYMHELYALQSACSYSPDPVEDDELGLIHEVTGAEVSDSVDSLIEYKDALEGWTACLWDALNTQALLSKDEIDIVLWQLRTWRGGYKTKSNERALHDSAVEKLELLSAAFAKALVSDD